MTPRQLFEQAIQITSVQERLHFVQKACAGNSRLEEEVLKLIEEHGHRQAQLTQRSTEATLEIADRTTDFSLHTNRTEHIHAGEVKLGQFLEQSNDTNAIGRIGHYSVLEVLGQGSFGIVLRAFDEKLHRVVAIKVLNPEFASTSPPRKRFLREARAAAAVKHENVVQIYSVEEEPIPYMVMEYVHGPTLQQYLDSTGPLETDELVRLCQQIVAGLMAAHDRGLIHRDIKPANVLLEKGIGVRVKITDFGLARAADDASMTRTGVICGTPMYMAPEQATGKALDHRADLFSLGSVMYQMACGRPPFRAENSIAVLMRVTNDAARPIREIKEDVPKWYCDIVWRLHRKAPEERFQSASEVLLAVNRGALSANSTSAAVGSENPTNRSSDQRLRWFSGAIVSLLLLVAVVITLQSFNKSRLENGDRLANHDQRSNQLLDASSPTITTSTEPIQAADAAIATTSHTNDSDSKPQQNQPQYAPTKDVQSNSQEASSEQPTSSEVSASGQALGEWKLPAGSPPPLISPCNSDRAKEIQKQWSDYKQVPTMIDSSVGLTFAVIPPGQFEKKFYRHPTTKDSAHLPRRTFRLDYVYGMSTTEVTNAQFSQFVKDTGYKTYAEQSGRGVEPGDGKFVSEWNWRNLGGKLFDDHPVVGVTQQDADQFCQWLSKKEGVKYRLPRQAEWLHAAKAGSDHRFVFSADADGLLDYANTLQTFDSISAIPFNRVRRVRPNAFGLYDMIGNVWERTSDLCDEANLLPYLSTVNPIGPPVGGIMGWSVVESMDKLRVDSGYSGYEEPSRIIGFRVVREIDLVANQHFLEAPLVVQAAQPMSAQASVPSPTPIKGLISWSIELRGASPTAGSNYGRVVGIGNGEVAGTSGTNGSLDFYGFDGAYRGKLLGCDDYCNIMDSAADLLLTRSQLRNLFVWNTRKKQLVGVIPGVSQAAISPDGNQIAVARSDGRGSIQVFDRRTNRCKLLPTVIKPVASLRWLPDNDHLVCSFRDDENDFAIVNVKTNTLRTTRIGATSSQVLAAPDGKNLLCLGSDRCLRWIDVASLNTIRKSPPHYHEWCDLHWMQGSNRVFIHKSEGGSELLDLDSFEAKKAGSDGWGHVALQDGLFAAIDSESGAFRIRDIETGALRKEVRLTGTGFSYPRFHSRSATLVNCSGGQIVLHDAISGVPLHQVRTSNHNQWRQSPDGTLIGCNFGGKTIQLQRISDGKLVHHFECSEDFSQVEFSPDSKKIVVGQSDGKVLIWNCQTGEQEFQGTAHQGPIAGLAWSADQSMLASSGQDGFLRIWKIDSKELTQVCEHKDFTHAVSFQDFVNGITWEGNEAVWVMCQSANIPYDVANRCVLTDRIIDSPSWNQELVISKELRRKLTHNRARQIRAVEPDIPKQKSILFNEFMGGLLVRPPVWTQDERYFVVASEMDGTAAFDADTGKRLGTLFPKITGGHWLCIGPTGHYRGSPDIEEMICYVALHEDGSQQTYTPEQFAARFGWKNDSGQAWMLPKSNMPEGYQAARSTITGESPAVPSEWITSEQPSSNSVVKDLSEWELPSGAPQPLLLGTKRSDAVQIQRAWATFMKSEVLSPSSSGLEFALIPPGEIVKEFSSPPGDQEDLYATPRSFRVTAPYRMSTTEVTVGQFRRFAEETKFVTTAERIGITLASDQSLQSGLTWKSPGYEPMDDHPVSCITANDAQAYCEWLSLKEGRNFRLPTEVEWQNAAHAGVRSRFLFGPSNEAVRGYAWTKEFVHGNMPNAVKQLLPNALGLHDVLGNLWELTSDRIEASFGPYLNINNPRGLAMSNGMGTSYVDSFNNCHTRYITGNTELPVVSFGFRVLEDIENHSSNTSAVALIEKNIPFGSQALTSQPTPITGLRTWSLALAGKHSDSWRESIGNRPIDGLVNTGSLFGALDFHDSNGEFREKLMGLDGYTTGLTSLDGKWIAITNDNLRANSNIHLWNTQTRKMEVMLQTKQHGQLAFSPDSSRLILHSPQPDYFSGRGLLEFDLASRAIRLLRTDHPVSAFAVAPHGDKVYALSHANDETHLHCYVYPEMNLLSSTKIENAKWANWVSVSPNGKLLLLGVDNRELRVLDAESKSLIQSIAWPVTYEMAQATWYSDSERLLIANSAELKVVRIQGEKPLFQIALGSNKSPILDEANNCIITYPYGADSFRFFDATTGAELNSGPVFKTYTHFLQAPNDRRLYVLHGNKVIGFDGITGDRVTQKPSPLNNPWNWSVSRNGQAAFFEGLTLATTDIHTLNTRKLHEFAGLEAPGADRFQLSATGEKLLLGNKGKYQIISTNDWNDRVDVSRVLRKADAMSLSPDGSKLAVANNEAKKIIIWNVLSSSVEMEYSREGVFPFNPEWNNFEFSPNGKSLWICGPQELIEIDVEEKRERRSWKTRSNWAAKSIAVSPDGRYLVETLSNYHHQIHDLQSQKEIASLRLPWMRATWSSDLKTIYFHHQTYGIIAFDMQAMSRAGTLVPSITSNHWVVCSPDGHYRGSEGVEEVLCYVAMHEDGSQHTYTPAQFLQKFGWQNDPHKAYFTR